MLRLTTLIACCLAALALAACGGDDDAGTPAASVDAPARTGPVNVPELVATGDAVVWPTLTPEEKAAVVERYLLIAGRSDVDQAELVEAADAGVGAADVAGSMREYLELMAAAVAGSLESDPVEPVTDVSFTSRCDYLLGDFTESASGYRLVADATLTSEANIGTINRVTALWDQIGGPPVKVTKTVRLRAGAKRKVGFTEVVSQDVIDRHQSADADCRVKVTTFDTFGAARE